MCDRIFSRRYINASSNNDVTLRPALRAEIARLARRHRRSFSEVAQDLMDEALRLRMCPGIYFADESSGREAKLAGTGLGVWEVIRDFLELGQNHAAVQKLFPHLSTAQIQACLLYYAKYPQEIDDAIEENRQLTWAAVRSRLSSVAKRR